MVVSMGIKKKRSTKLGPNPVNKKEASAPTGGCPHCGGVPKRIRPGMESDLMACPKGHLWHQQRVRAGY